MACLVAADDKTVREVIHAFNTQGLSCLVPQWAGGHSRLLTPDEQDLVIHTATMRPAKLGRPFTRWSLRKLADYLAHRPGPAYRPRDPALSAPPARHHLSAHHDLEELARPRAGRQTRLHRARHGALR
ncbi:helix-turn-helix domain-containing protein [Nocardiopsis sp. ARC36]